MTAENLTARVAPGDAVRFGNFPPWYTLTAVDARHLTLDSQYAGPEQSGTRVVRRAAGGEEDTLCTACASVSSGDSAVAVTEDVQGYLHVGDGVAVGDCESVVIKHATATQIVLAEPSECEASDAPVVRDSFAFWKTVEGACRLRSCLCAARGSGSLPSRPHRGQPGHSVPPLRQRKGRCVAAECREGWSR